jgi:hypothetical protein
MPPEPPPKVATAGSGPTRLGRSKARWIVGTLILLLVPTAIWIWISRPPVAIDPTPLPGALVLSSRVAGAEVWVGTDKLGETTAGGTLVQDNLPPGSYRVTAQKPGYQPWERDIQITANQRTDVVIDLQLLKPTPKPPVGKPPSEPSVFLPTKDSVAYTPLPWVCRFIHHVQICTALHPFKISKRMVVFRLPTPHPCLTPLTYLI